MDSGFDPGEESTVGGAEQTGYRSSATADVDFFDRQASEQYFTDSQFFAQALRQVISRPQTAQGLLGK